MWVGSSEILIAQLRFQENEGVQKSIQNAIRYHADKDFKSQYHSDLEQQILARDNKAQAVREQDVNISRQLEVKSDFSFTRSDFEYI